MGQLLCICVESWDLSTGGREKRDEGREKGEEEGKGPYTPIATNHVLKTSTCPHVSSA